MAAAAAVTVHLLCHNEAVLLPRTVAHYRAALPSCRIVVVDNGSTDGSRALAAGLGCTLVAVETEGMDENALTDVRDGIWRDATTPWVVVADMDEWLDIGQEALDREDAAGTTILRTCGVQVVGSSASPTLADVPDLAALRTGYFSNWFSKRACFKRTAITAMHYGLGAHQAFPRGDVRWSLGCYTLKHYSYLGLPWLRAKWAARAARVCARDRASGTNMHYKVKEEEVVAAWEAAVARARPFVYLDGAPGSAIVFHAWGSGSISGA
jgi:glycosyltransferase involved in cell wall biosynthesis